MTGQIGAYLMKLYFIAYQPVALFYMQTYYSRLVSTMNETGCISYTHNYKFITISVCNQGPFYTVTAMMETFDFDPFEARGYTCFMFNVFCDISLFYRQQDWYHQLNKNVHFSLVIVLSFELRLLITTLYLNAFPMLYLCCFILIVMML